MESVFSRGYLLGYHGRGGESQPDLSGPPKSGLFSVGSLLFCKHVHHAKRFVERISDVLLRGFGLLPGSAGDGRTCPWLLFRAAVFVLAVSKADRNADIAGTRIAVADVAS